MSTAIANANRAEYISNMLHDTRQDAISGALMGVMTPEQFIGQCLVKLASTDITDKAPAEEVVKGILEVAGMGLTLTHDLAYLVPYGGKVVAMPGWKGIKVLLERMPGVRMVTPNLVHKNDRFAFMDGEVEHEYDPFLNRAFRHPETLGGEVPDLRGGYLQIRHTDGLLTYHVVAYDKFEKARMCSQVPYQTSRGKPGVWLLHYEEMCLKTVLRNAYARGAISYDPVKASSAAVHLDAALAVEDRTLGNRPDRPSVQLKSTTPMHDLIGGSRLVGEVIDGGAGDSGPGVADDGPPHAG